MWTDPFNSFLNSPWHYSFLITVIHPWHVPFAFVSKFVLVVSCVWSCPSRSVCTHWADDTQNAKVCVWLCLCCLLMYLFVCVLMCVNLKVGFVCGLHTCFVNTWRLIAAPSALCSGPVAYPANNISCVCICVCYCFSLRCHWKAKSKFHKYWTQNRKGKEGLVKLFTWLDFSGNNLNTMLACMCCAHLFDVDFFPLLW